MRDWKELPNNIDAEQALLGSLLWDNRGIDSVDFLIPEHFYHPTHAEIYAVICDFIQKSKIANPVTLKPIFLKHAGLADLGGIQYLVEMAVNCDKIANTSEYARVIFHAAKQREFIGVADTMRIIGFGDSTDEIKTPWEMVERAEKLLYDLVKVSDNGKGFQSLEAPMKDTILQAEAAMKNEGQTGITTGLIDLDKMIGGLNKSDLLILAARPSMGKTALGVNIAVSAAQTLESGCVGVFSLEMSSRQLATRILSMESGISSVCINQGYLNNNTFSNLVDKSEEIVESVPIFIDDTPALPIATVRNRARRLKRKHNLKLLVVDYLQLLHGSGKTNGNRVQEVSEISQGLKAIAKELDIPVIALSQLSRALESREDKRPMLSDLRESGSIEQDADIVMFLYRDEYYLKRREPDESSPKYGEWLDLYNQSLNKADLFIAKNRHGAIGGVKMIFNENTTKFSSFTENKGGEIEY